MFLFVSVMQNLVDTMNMLFQHDSIDNAAAAENLRSSNLLNDKVFLYVDLCRGLRPEFH